MNLSNLIDNTKTDKNTTHSYLEVYEMLFKKKQNTAKNILEIGIQSGGSIKLWHDYFRNATIYGLDIQRVKNTCPEIRNKSRIKLGCFDAYSEEFINNQMKPLNVKFDIMIDDGPHTLESMIFFIENYLPMLKDDGILIIEDVASIDWIDKLTNVVPNELKKCIDIHDLRSNKNRYDDILFVINLSQK
jgi:cephalosporin hydroxylase